MSITIVANQPSPTGWTNIDHLGANAQDMYPVEGRGLTYVEELVNPARSYRVTLTVWAAPQDPTSPSLTVLIQGRAYLVAARSWQTLTHDVDPLRPLKIEIAAVAYANTRYTLTATDVSLGARPEPWEMLALDALVPIETSALVWDRDRWDRASFNEDAPAPGTLIWGSGQWDRAYWYDQAATSAWRSILGPCTRITSRRGMGATGPVLTAEAGTLQIEATEDLDPRGLGMVVGTPVRLYLWTDRTPIWTGRISDISITPIKGGGANVKIQCVDDIAALAAITRYGARPDGGGTETWRQRLARLATSAPGIPLTAAVSSQAPICPTVWETSLAHHIDALVATTGGAWWARRDSGANIYATLPDPTTPDLTLTDTHDDDATPGAVWYYTAGDSAWQTGQIITAIEATTHDAAQNTQTGEWNAADTTVVVTDPTTSAAWSGATARVDLVTPSAGSATRDAATRLLRRAAAAPLLQSATVTHTHPRASDPAQAMRLAARLDPLTSCMAVARAERTLSLIAAITHTLTPTSWQTSLDLTPTERTP